MKNFILVLIGVSLTFQFTVTQAQNLIFNPGCEDSLINGEIPYWTEVIGTNWTHQVSGNPPAFEGDYIFFPGVASVAELQQDVDVSSEAPAIDSSIQYFYFIGYVRVYNQIPPDHSRIILEYLDTLKIMKLDSIDLGEYNNTAEWFQLSDSTLAPVGTRFIRIRLISTRYNGSNNNGYYDGLSLEADIPAGISINSEIFPKEFIVYQNYPNPFNPSTVISYQLPVSSEVTLKVYDILGNEIATLVNEYKPAGRYGAEFSSLSGIRDLASGIYFYQLKAGEFIKTKKMVLIK